MAPRAHNKQQGKSALGRGRDVTHGGDGVVETDGGIVMVRGVLPGDRVRLRVLGKRGGVARGELLEILEPSPDRVEPACALASRCGGCPLMTLAPAAQHALKLGRLRQALGDGPAPEPELTNSPSSLAYRGRARMAFARRGRGQLTLGYRAAGSSRPVDVPTCPILLDSLNGALGEARRAFADTLQGSGEFRLGSGAGGRAVLHVSSEETQPAEVYRAAEALSEHPAVAGVTLAIAGAAAARFGDARQCTLAPDGEPLWSAVDGFAQANPALNAALVTTAIELAEPDGARVLELYAGHGNFTVPLAERARTLSAIESDRAATEACRQNLSDRGLGQRARVSCEAAEQAASRSGEVDVVLLDPPRTGARDAIAGLLARRPSRIVYVSCDPATLRRDLQPLRAAGYRVDAAHGFDMFPHTPHVEAVVRLVR